MTQFALRLPLIHGQRFGKFTTEPADSPERLDDVDERGLTFVDLGDQLIGLGRHAEALEALNKAVSLVPNDGPAWRNRGLALLRMDRHDEALEALSRAIDLKSDDAAAWFLQAEVLVSLDRWEEAQDALGRATGLAPDDPSLN